MYFEPLEQDHDDHWRLLKEVVPNDPAVPYEHQLVAGDPAAAIVALAERQGVDLIVMGSHGRKGIPRLLLGSVAELVVRKANCPVLTCKQTVCSAPTVAT